MRKTETMKILLKLENCARSRNGTGRENCLKKLNFYLL